MNKTREVLLHIKDILGEYNKDKCNAEDALNLILNSLPVWLKGLLKGSYAAKAPLPTKTPKNIRTKLLCLINSSAEGYNGTWVPTGEGNEGFQYMYQDALDIAKHFKVNVKGHKELN